MRTTALVDLFCAVFVGITFLRSFSEHSTLKSSKLLNVCLLIMLLTLIDDAMAYTLIGPSYPVALRYSVNLLSFLAVSVIAFAFTCYSETLFREKGQTRSWLFAILKIVEIIWFLATVYAYAAGHLITYDANGVESLDYTVPSYINILQTIILVGIPAATIVNRRFIDIRQAVLMCLFGIVPIFSSWLYTSIGADFSYALASVTIVLMTVFTQKIQTDSFQDRQQKNLQEAHDAIDRTNRRNQILHEAVKASTWTYEINDKDEVVAARYERNVEGKTIVKKADAPMPWIDALHPEDRERVMNEFMSAIYDHTCNTPYETTYRIMNSSGGYIWVKSSGRLSRSEDGTAELYGISIDITAQIEEQQKHLLGAIAISPDILAKENIGMWAFELDEGQPPRMYGDEAMLRLVGLDHQVPPEEMYHAWYDHIDEGSYGLVNDAVAKMMAGEHAEVQYPWHHPDGGTLIVRCGGTRNPEYAKGIRVEGTHQNVTEVLHFDDEERKALAENNARMLALEDNIVSLYDLDLETGEYEMYVKGDPNDHGIIAQVVKSSSFYEDTMRNLSTIAYPEDRDGLIDVLTADHIRRALEEDSHFDYYYRLMAGDAPVWAKMRMVYKDEEKRRVIIGAFNAEEEMEAKQKEEQSQRELLTRMSGDEGVFLVDCVNDTRRTIHDRVHSSEEFSDANGYSDNIGRYIDAFVAESDRERMREVTSPEYIMDRLKSENEFTVRYRELYTGEPRWFEMHTVKVSDASVLQSFKDIDDQVITEQATEAMNKDVFGIYVVDLRHDLVRVVKRVSTFLGDSKRTNNKYSDVIQSFVSILSGKARKQWEGLDSIEGIRAFMKDQDKREFVFESPAREGKLVRMTWYVIERTEGEAETVCFALTDLDKEETERERLNEQIADQKEQLQEVNLRNQILYEISNAIKWSYEIGADDEIVSYSYANQADEIVKSDNFEGNPMAWADIVHPEDRDAAIEAFESAIHDHSDETPYDSTYRIMGTNGKYVWLKVAGRMHRREDGSGEMFGISIDVTEQMEKEREQQQQLEEALSMAQSANRAKTTFLNNMSHDIRTPMNAIIGYTGLAASHIDNKEQVQDYLNKIGQSSDHLLSLINDVLDMSRIESGKMNLEERPENLPDIIHTLRDIVQSDIHSKQLDFYVDAVDVNDEDIVCDKLRLNQVLLNVLSNAIKYTAAGGTVTLRVKEKTVKKNGYATYEFRIKDNGMGMSKEFLDTIYDPFTRVKSSTVSGIQGTGLGMAITKNIVDMMGGKIEIDSEPSKGTEVSIEFDFRLVDGRREPMEIPELRGMRGLVVDDDSNTCLSISNMLKDVGMRYEWCTSGKEAIIRAEAAYKNGDLFKVYVIDWIMPDMNGIETTRRIRKVIGNDAPIIILTAYDYSDIEDEAREAGVTAFVSKPMFPSDLHRVLNRCLGKEEEDKDASKEYGFAGKKILLVEDNELNREIATEILEENGFIMDVAEDGDIAVEKMRNAKPGDYDLVLMDIQMPRMDGYEATRQIRALDTEISRIPILAMTANAFEEDKKLALEAGMDEHIAKPIDIEKLKETLAKFLK